MKIKGKSTKANTTIKVTGAEVVVSVVDIKTAGSPAYSYVVTLCVWSKLSRSISFAYAAGDAAIAARCLNCCTKRATLDKENCTWRDSFSALCHGKQPETGGHFDTSHNLAGFRFLA